MNKKRTPGLDQHREAVGQPFDGHDGELAEEHRHIGGHAQTHFKEHGSRARIEEGVGQAQRMAEVVMQGHHHEEIAQKGRGDGGAHGGVEAFEPEHIAGDGGKVAPRGQRHAAEQVKADPDAPRLVVVKVGDGTNALREAHDGHDQTDCEQNPGDDVARGRPEHRPHVEHLVLGRDDDFGFHSTCPPHVRQPARPEYPRYRWRT